MIDKPLRAFARDVAAHLDGFREAFDEGYTHLAWIVHHDGRRLRMCRTRDDSRVAVTCERPRGNYRLDLEDPCRTFALGRDPAKVAAEIVRVIMPGYVRDLRQIRAHLARQDEITTQHAATVTRLLDLIPDASLPYGVGKDNSTIIYWLSSVHGCRGDIQVNRGVETVVLTVENLPIPLLEQAMAILTGPAPAVATRRRPADK